MSARSRRRTADALHGHGVLRGREGVTLTERELEVLQRVAAGHSERRVAADLGLSRSGVRSRLEGARRKLLLALEEAQ